MRPALLACYLLVTHPLACVPEDQREAVCVMARGIGVHHPAYEPLPAILADCIARDQTT